MNWQALLDPGIQKFILSRENDDISQLALDKPPKDSWPMPLILEQIKARQKARKKIPHWCDVPDIIFPPADLLEQASSFACAMYKASITEGQYFADLTAGCGIDTAAMANKFPKGLAVDINQDTADLLAHNFMVSGEDHILVVHHDAQSYIEAMPEVDIALIDPQRRDGKRRGIYTLEECSPNVMVMLADLQKKAKTVLIKTSPILDIHKTITDLQHVYAVHIVEYQGECKEVLYALCFDQNITPDNTPIHAVSINDLGQILHHTQFTFDQENQADVQYAAPETFLYEPMPALMKSGGYKYIAAQYGLKKLAPNTHLYTSETAVPAFPGRIFEITGQSAAKAKELKAHLPSMRANLTARNFPMSVDDLRKKLKIKDGGNDYVFACQNHEKKNILITCVKFSEKTQ